MNIKPFDIEDRVQQATLNFESGFNCSQSVFLAYSDVLDMDIETASKISVSFGGGLAHMREVCGTISAMAMLAGFKYPVLDPNDQESRAKNYAVVQAMINVFKKKHGNIICRHLLEKLNDKAQIIPQDSSHVKVRPCSKFVEDAARIAGQMLKGEFEG